MGFLHPGLLGLLGLGAVPVVIHLLNRRRYQVVKWPAMAFLLSAQVKTRQRLRMENLLLLLVRTLIVLLFAFAASRPFLPLAEALAALGPDRRHLYVVIDNSASMDYREGMSSLLERAAKEARDAVDGIRPDDPVTLVLGCDEMRRRNGRPVTLLRGTRDHGKVKETLSRLVTAGLSAGRFDPAAALAEVAAVADPADVRRVLLVLSDFQQSDWAPAGAPAAEGEDAAAGATRAIRTQLDRLEGMRFELPGAFRFLGGPDPVDVAVLSVGPADGRAPAEGRPLSFEVVVGNNGPAPASAEVRFSVDGAEIGTRRVALRGRPSRSPGPETARASFQWTGAAGNHFAEAAVTFPGDGLAANSVRRHAFAVRERIRTLLVDGDPAPSGDRFPETGLLETILSLRSGVAAADVTVLPSDELARAGPLAKRLGAADVVVLANVDRVPDGAWDALASFVKGGGGLFVFLGDRVDPSFWNEACRRPTTADLLPARLPARPVVRPDAPASLDLGASSHPALRDLTDPRAGSVFEPPLVSGWWPVQEPAEGTEVLLRLGDLPRSPWLLERRFGRGRVLLCTSSADLDWTGMSLFFAPFVQETVSYLASSGAERRDILVHEPLVAEVPPPAEASKFQVVDPAGQAFPDLESSARPDGGPHLLTFADTGRAGIYFVRWTRSDGAGASSGDRGVPFAADIAPPEADIARLRPEALAERFQKRGLGGAGPGEASAKVREREAARGDLTGLAVGLGLLMVVAEMFLASFFGRRRR